MTTHSAELLLQRTSDLIIQSLSVLGFEIRFEDDYADFKHLLFRDIQRRHEFNAGELVIFAVGEGSGHLCIEFHASLHTAKGRALQRSLGKDDFRVPRAFIEDVVFAQAGLEVAEYRPVERRYPKTSDPWFALDGPPATIVIAGWLSEKG